mmetsp:Transcript_34704/g.79537  ORF Transcript_34704/g.79537 Transcript_34704/m.79537 type:complete len:274 (+) Transcript_34704:116-937(+)
MGTGASSRSQQTHDAAKQAQALDQQLEKHLRDIPLAHLTDLPQLQEQIRLIQVQLTDLDRKLAGTSTGKKTNAQAKDVLGQVVKLWARLSSLQAALKEREMLLEGSSTATNVESGTPVTGVPSGGETPVSPLQFGARDMSGSVASEPELGSTVGSHQKKQNSRGYSKASLASLDKLNSLEHQLSSMETRVAEITALLKQGVQRTDIVTLRTELAQLESRAKQLEGRGVDDIYTSELRSGREEAKAFKKDMLSRFEALFNLLEETFASLKAQAS